jgi:hypothetical protein
LNRQAFFHLALSMIAGEGWRLLVYADLEGLKEINDRHRHAACACEPMEGRRHGGASDCVMISPSSRRK